MEKTYTPLFSEILDKVHKAKTKDQKVQILRENNITYKEHNIDEDHTSKMVLKALRLKTVPQIWNDDLHLGGYRQLESWIGENYDSNYINEN